MKKNKLLLLLCIILALALAVSAGFHLHQHAELRQKQEAIHNTVRSQLHTHQTLFVTAVSVQEGSLYEHVQTPDNLNTVIETLQSSIDYYNAACLLSDQDDLLEKHPAYMDLLTFYSNYLNHLKGYRNCLIEGEPEKFSYDAEAFFSDLERIGEWLSEMEPDTLSGDFSFYGEREFLEGVFGELTCEYKWDTALAQNWKE